MVLNTKQRGDAGLNENAINSNRTAEYLVDLQGREGSLKYRQMSRGDTQCGMILKVHKNPILSASWGISEPEDASNDEKLAIEVLNSWLFDSCNTSFDTTLGQILSFLEYGYSCFERTWEVFQFKGTKYFAPTLHQRLQTSIENIYPDRHIIQQSTISKGLVDIPFEFLTFFILNQQGEDMRGESILRNAYYSFKKKKIYEEWEGMGIQRSATGIPSMKVPKNTKVDSKEYIAVEQLLSNITQHENAYMIYEEGYEFLVHESKFNPEQIQKSITYQDSQMALSVLAQFVLLGQQGKGGAYALSRDQSDFFLDGLQYVINLVERVYHKQIISRFLELNFGDKIDCTRIKLKGLNLNKKAGEELASVLSQFRTSGFIKPTINDEIQLRKSLELTKLTDEEIEDRQKEPEVIPFDPNNTLPITQPKKKAKTNPKEVEEEEQNRIRHATIKFAETKIKNRSEYINKTVKEMNDLMKANLLTIKDKLMHDIERTLNKGMVEIRGLKNIDVSSSKYRKNLETKLSGIALDGFHKAKADAKKNKVKLADPKDITNPNLKQYVLNEATSISEDQVSSLKNRAILTASNGPLKGLSVSNTMSNVDRVVDTFIESSAVRVGAALLVVGTANFGEMEFNKTIEDELWGYRFVAVDDDRTTEICGWYNGRTFSVNSPELAEATAPLHASCRSYMEPIYKSEEKPEIENVIAPPTVRDQKTIY